MRLIRVFAALSTVAGLAACVSTPDAPSGPPSVAYAAATSTPAQAGLYADCLGQAAQARTYDKDPNADLIRFTCTGAPARALYDGLGSFSAQIDSQFEAEGRTWRFSTKLRQDPSGADGCSADHDTDHRCVLMFNAGEFLSF